MKIEKYGFEVAARAPKIESPLVFNYDSTENEKLHAVLVRVVAAAWKKATGSKAFVEDISETSNFESNELRFDVTDVVDFTVRFTDCGDVDCNEEDIEVKVWVCGVVTGQSKFFYESMCKNMSEGDLVDVVANNIKTAFKTPTAKNATNTISKIHAFLQKATA